MIPRITKQHVQHLILEQNNHKNKITHQKNILCLRSLTTLVYDCVLELTIPDLLLTGDCEFFEARMTSYSFYT